MVMCLRYRHLHERLWRWGAVGVGGQRGLGVEGGWRRRGLGVGGVGGGGGWGQGVGDGGVEGDISGALRNKDLDFHICKVHTHIRTQYI